MAHEYANLLSKYDNKGELGAPEFFDTDEESDSKIKTMAEWIQLAKCVLVITGAGISTSAGIADFRGPKGIWTLEKEEKSLEDVDEFLGSFEDARPTLTHDALRILEQNGKIAYLISQNVDGLHSRYGFPLDRLSEIHGNVFQKRCNRCNRVEFNTVPLKSVGRNMIGEKCLSIPKPRNRCTGDFCDFLLDWDDELPEPDYSRALKVASSVDLVICLGTSLQIEPIGSLPLKCKKKNAKIVTVNLQKTRIEKKVDLPIHRRVDEVMCQLLNLLDLPINRSTNVNIVQNSSSKLISDTPKKRKRVSNMDNI
ncbi:unnamed protein product [Bursaphelenchus okinawaensis]|uniref:protein acetyllysine N-acetyltransferase n=1 Tax=Bursaphelenchus okinawaensis TaxID=465554 RepID=A0A811KIW2_9BILA|nr:unnamed protein product [Bursaphelenchus okinawaensis]CAG9103546.1 unnamed protein product [Bursaphelenchus okinawaensis]